MIDGEVDESNPYILPDRLIYDMVELISRVEEAYYPESRQKLTYRSEHLSFRPPDIVYEEDFKRAIHRTEKLGICKNRLWNTISGCPRDWLNLPALLALIDEEDGENSGIFTHMEDFGLRTTPTATANLAEPSIEYDHQACTSDLCHFSSMDSTRVAQIHKCPESDRPSCPLIHFPPANEKSPDRLLWNFSTDSSVSTEDTAIYKALLTSGEYVAISHVWSMGLEPGFKVKA